MDISTDKNKFKVKIDGKEFLLSMTKLKDEVLIDNIVAAENEGKPTSQMMIDLLISLGLEKEITEALATEDVIAILKGMRLAKKNLLNQVSSSPS